MEVVSEMFVSMETECEWRVYWSARMFVAEGKKQKREEESRINKELFIAKKSYNNNDNSRSNEMVLLIGRKVT